LHRLALQQRRADLTPPPPLELSLSMAPMGTPAVPAAASSSPAPAGSVAAPMAAPSPMKM